MKVFDIDDLARRYLTGESAKSIGKSCGVKDSTVRQWLRKHGVIIRGCKDAGLARRIVLDDVAIVERYKAGEPVYKIAKSLGVDRNAINRRIIDAGMTIRNWKESLEIQGISHPTQRMSKAERLRVTANAHAALKGTHKTFEQLCNMAIGREQRGEIVSIVESRVHTMILKSCPGIVIVPQKAVGSYNIDIALAESSVAVEIFGGNWHSTGIHASRFRKRTEYLIDSGWFPIIVWVTRSYPIEQRAIDYIIAIHQRRCRKEPMPREYKVIWGTGEVIPAAEINPENGAPKIRFHGTYRPRGIDGRFAK